MLPRIPFLSLGPFALSLVFSLPGQGRSQAIRGQVLDADTGRPVDGTSVMLLDFRGELVKGVLTDGEGSFLMVAPRTARYRIRLERIGYESTTAAEIDLLPPDTVEVELSMSMAAVVLAPLTIRSHRGPLVMDTRLASWGYYDRMAYYQRFGSGVTHFLTIQDIRKRNPMRVTDVFRDLPGLRVASIGGSKVAVKGRLGCKPTFYLDGVELRIPDDETLDEYLLASSLSAVEVYARPPFPAQYAPRSTGIRQCASIVLWTGYVDGKDQP